MIWNGTTSDCKIQIVTVYPNGIKKRSIESAYEFSSTPGSIVVTYEFATMALASSIPIEVKICFVKHKIIETGIKIIEMTRIDRCK